MRTCKNCNETKPLDKFRGGRTICKPCNYLKSKKFFETEEGKEYRRTWQANERATRPLLGMLRHARARAKAYNLPFDIEEKDLTVPEFCPVLGVKIQVNKGSSKYNSPTIDRVIPSLGYVKGNVVVISKKANTIKNDATLEELKQVTAWLERQING